MIATSKRLLIPLFSLIVFPLTGCKMDREDIHTLGKVEGGQAKLNGYLADTDRPIELRVEAANRLLDLYPPAIPEIMYRLENATDEDRKMIGESLVRVIIKYIEQKDPAKKMRAAELSYHLFKYIDEFTTQMDDKPRDVVWIDSVVTWLTDILANEDSMPQSSQPPEEILIAAALVRPKLTLPEIYSFLEKAPSTERFLIVNRVLTAIGTTEVLKKQAELLLKHADTIYPNVSPELADALYENRNETLLQYLLDAARDPDAPLDMRNLAISGKFIKGAAPLPSAADILKDKAIPRLRNILLVDDPKSQNGPREIALAHIWKYGGTVELKKALMDLPMEATWWPNGTEFRERVTDFCKYTIGENATEQVLGMFKGLVSDPNWVTRAYAIECLRLRSQDDLTELLEPLETDDTVLRGWCTDSPEITIGEYVQAYPDACPMIQ